MSCCVNPLVYCCMSKRFRAGFANAFACVAHGAFSHGNSNGDTEPNQQQTKLRLRQNRPSQSPRFPPPTDSSRTPSAVVCSSSGDKGHRIGLFRKKNQAKRRSKPSCSIGEMIKAFNFAIELIEYFRRYNEQQQL